VTGEQSAAAGAGDRYPEDDSTLQDEPNEIDQVPPGDEAAPIAPHPLDGLTDQELARRLDQDPASLGSISIGSAHSGALLNGVQMPEGPYWTLVDPAHAWGTQETVDYLCHALTAVAEKFPGTAPVAIGHISAKRGGPLRPHVSHQSGRDVDVGLYYLGPPNHWYARATPKNIDAPRTWFLIRTLVTDTDIEMILLDGSLQRPIEQYAIDIGEPEAWVRGLFRGTGKLPPVVRHAPGHATHLHLRFYNPIAQESARRLLPLLVAHHLIRPPVYTITHVAKRGDTLGRLARKFGTTVAAIRRANGLRGTVIIAGRSYRIPQHGRAYFTPRLRIPPRRLPP